MATLLTVSKKVLHVAFASAFFTAVFTLLGVGAAINSGRTLWAGAAVGAVVGLLMGTGVAYPRART